MTQEQIKEKLLVALKAAKEHLDFCGYGDSYERECARAAKLEEQITEAIAAAEEDPCKSCTTAS